MKSNINKYTLNFFKKNSFEMVEASESSPKEKSDIIYRILAGIPLPLIVLEEKNEKYLVISGAEIISAVRQFIFGDLELGEKEELIAAFVKEENNLFFDFSDAEKFAFFEKEVGVCIFRQLSEKEKEVIQSIFASKKAVPVSISENAIIVTELTDINSIPVNDVLENYLTNAFFRKVNIDPLTIDHVIQLFMVDESGVKCDLSAKMISEYKNSFTEYPDITKELEYLNEAYPEKTIYLKKAHLPMIYVCARKALKQNILPKRFKQIIDAFFESNNKDYKKASDNGTATKSNVNTRIRTMLNYFNSQI